MAKNISQLAEFVRDDRQKRRLTQRAYEELLNAPKNYVSKVETGTIIEPNYDFLSAVGDLTERSADQLRAWAHTTTEGVDPLLLACGHTLWGASVFLAANRGLPDFRCFTYESRHKGDDGFAPVFIGAHGRRADEIPGPGLSGGTSEIEFVGISTADVLDRLERGEIDIGALPGALLEGHPSLLSVARIVDTTYCASLVCRADLAREFFPVGQSADQPSDAIDSDPLEKRIHPIGTKELGSVIRRLDVQIAAEPDTIALICLRDAVQHAFPRESRITQEFRVEERLLGIRTSDFAWRNYDSLFQARGAHASDSDSSHSAVIAWEPQASWLTRSCRRTEDQRLYSIPLYFSFGNDLAPKPLTFDIVIRRLDSADVHLQNGLRELIAHLWSATQTLNALQRGEFTQDLMQIARYYKLADVSDRRFAGESIGDGIADVVGALNTIRFVTYMDFEESRALGGAPQ